MKYTADDLRACWSFVRQDFERFLDLIAWLDSLPEGARAQQLESARSIFRDREKPQAGQGGLKR